MKRVLLILVTVLLAGCGGGGEAVGTEGISTSADVAANQRELDKQIAYDFGVNTCAQYSLEEAAEIYGVKANAEAIADAVSKDEQDRELQKSARDGCLAAYKK